MNTNENRIGLLKWTTSTLTLAGACLAIAPMAIAQEAPDDAVSAQEDRQTSAERVFETVTVTARKKSDAELSQNVPISVTGYGAEQLEAIQAVDLKDLGGYTPNVELRETRTVPGTTAFFIRGAGQGQSIQTLQPAVGVFQDGIYLGTMVGAVVDTFDVESVEILRGPQGTLFGRNVSGGAVNVRTRRPTDEFEGALRLTGGSENLLGISGRINIPLSDSVSALFAINNRTADGYLKNLDPASDTIGEVDVLNGRAAILFEPSDNFDLTLIAGTFQNKGGGSPSAAAVQPPQAGFVGQSQRPDFWETGNNTVGFTDQDIWYLTAEANWELDGGVITAIAGHRDLSHENFSDGDGTSDDFFRLLAGVDHVQDSLEVRYATTGRDWGDLTVGAFYWDSEIEASEYRMIAGGRVGQAGLGIEDNTAMAVFAQGDFALSPTLDLTLGLRYNYEEKDFQVARLGSGACPLTPINGLNELGSFDPGACAPEFSDSESWNNLSPKVGLRWRPNDDAMFYASYSTGYRSGAYNARTDTRAVDARPADEETTDAFEVGAKLTWMDGRARTNVAIFRNNISDYQEIDQIPTTLGPSQQLVNVGEAVTQGFEVEGNFLLTDRWTLAASIGYLDAYYEDLNLTGVTAQQYENWDFVKVPDWSYSLASTYEQPLGEWGYANLRVAYSHRDSMAAAFNNDSNPNRFAPLDELNASLAFTSADERWSFILSGKNLTEEESADSRFFVGPYLLEFVNPPRTWSASLQYNF